MNGKAAIQVLEALRDKAKSVREEIDNLDKKAPDFKEQKAGLEKVYDALQSAHENIIKDTERLDTAIQNLSSTSLQNLRKALGDGRRQLQKLSEDELAKSDEIRKKMKMAGDQIRLLEGQYVKIADGLKNVKNQSDQWLDKALKQQRDLVGSLQKSDASYQQNLATLKQLEAEEDRRKGKMSVTEARQTVSNSNASASDLRRAKTTLTEARDNTPTGNSSDIARYNSELQEIEKRLEAVSGKAQKATMSWKEMRQVLSAPNKASGEDIKRTMEVIQQKIQQLPAGSKYVATLRRQYTMLEQTLKGTRMSQMALNDIINRSKQGKASLDELRRAYKQLEEELNQVNTKSKEFADKQKSMKELKKNIDEVTGAVNKNSGAWQTAMRNLMAYVGLFGAFNMLKSKLTDVLKLNFQYSDSLANVRKVSNLSMESVNDLSRQLAKIDSRTSLEGLTQLAYVGSRMGMGKYGASGLAEFAAASDRVNVALKEDLGDDAMLILSKFVETMGEVEKHGGNISDAFDSVSSSIFKLASTSTANGGSILEFARRLTGLSKVSHITSDQLLGLASASDSLMLMPEVASTAFGKLISSLWTNYHDIEKMLGMQEDSLKDMMSKGETMQALVTVLQNVSDKNLNSMDEYFKEFGSDGQRLKSVVVTMAQNVDVLKSHLDESSKAYKDATAVSKEYAIQQETAQAIIERANNMWNKAFVNPEGIDAVKEIAKAWYDFSKTLTQSAPFMMSVKILMWEIKTSVEMLLKILPGLVAYMGTRGLVWAFSKLLPLMIGVSGSGVVKFFTLLTMAVSGNAAAVRLLHIRWTAMSLAMKANAIGLAISAIATLGTWIYSLAKNTDNATKSIEQFDRSLTGVYNKANQAVGELDAYYRAIKRAKKGSLEYQAAIKVYNDKFGVYFKKLERENGMVKDLAASYREAAKAIRAKMYVQMEQEDRDKFVKPRAGRSLDRLGEYGQIAPKGFGTEMLEAYTKDTYGKQMNVVIKELAQKFGVKDVSNVLASENRGLTKAVRREKVQKRTLFGDPYYAYEDKDVSANEQQLFRALRYVRQERATHNADLGIYKKYNPVRKQMDNYILSTTGGNEDLNVPGGSGKVGGGKTVSGGNTNTTEKNVAKDRANALIANIKAFYEEQMRKYLEWVTQMNADGEKISEGQQKEQMDYLQSRMNLALGKARQSIATLDTGWKEFFQYMDEDVMVYDDETSKQLLESIGKADISELHDLFSKLSGDLSRENNKTLSENLGALLDQIFANGSKELREAAEKLLARQREIQKILNEHDYTGAVNRNTRSEFDRLGFLKPAKDVRSDSPEGLEKMNAAFDKLTTKARESITVLYSLNPESKDFQSQFLDFLSVANEGFDFSKLKAQDLKALYLELIKYNDEYIAAEKKRYDEAKKLTNQKWAVDKRNLAQQERIRQIQEESNLFGKRTNFLSNLGLADLTADPEILLMKARMQAAEDYYAFVVRNTKNKQLIDEAERARQEAELAYANQMATAMKSRLSQMNELVKPIEDFGTAVGQALAEMKNDAKSANEAIRSALKSMLESWGKMAVNDVNTQMWKAINDAAAKRGRANAQPDIDAARANAKASYTDFNGIDWRNFGTESKPLWVRWKGDHYEDKSGDAVYVKEDGTPLPNPDGSVPQPNEPPRAWKKRHPDGTIDDYNKEVAAFGGQIGSAAVDVATGNSSMGDVAAGIAMSGANALFNTNIEVGKKDNKDKKNRKKELRDEKKHQKDLADIKKKGVAAQEKIVDKGQENMTQTTKEGSEEQKQATLIAQNATLAGTEQALATAITAKKETDNEAVESEADSTEKRMNLSLAGAVAKCFDFLGPIAGPIAAAVVTATLNGLLQWAISSAFSSSKKSSSSKGPNTKLVSGMLTYDSGNVQDLKPFVANDGSLYWATEDNKPHSGVSLLTQPTATTINGQPSLVAENGPELVIGRETTHAMMMNNPQLLKALVNYDRNYSGRSASRRAFDEGNVGATVGNLPSGASATDDLMTTYTASNMALLQAVNTLLQRLEQPIEAKIDMFGRDKLYDSMNKANRFMKGK